MHCHYNFSAIHAGYGLRNSFRLLEMGCWENRAMRLLKNFNKKITMLIAVSFLLFWCSEGASADVFINLAEESVSLSWTPGDPDIDSYEVSRSINGLPYNPAPGGTTSNPSWVDNNVYAGNFYRYTVTARDICGNVSAPSLPSDAVYVSDDGDFDGDGYSDTLELAMETDPLDSFNQPAATSLVLSPTLIEIPIGVSAQLSVTGTFYPQVGDPIQEDVTCGVGYDVSSLGVASVDGCGNVVGLASGTIQVWATQNGGPTSNVSTISVVAPTTLYVPDDHSTIQQALDAAFSGDTIVVRDGVYSGPGNRDLDFGGKALVLRSENGADTCIIDCEYGGRGFKFWNSETTASVVEGFTIMNGDADSGGGIYCVNSSPLISDCVIRDSSASYGGGVCLSSSSAEFANCTIVDNFAEYGAGGVYANASDATFVHCTISNNQTVSGGGIFCESGSPTITNSILWGNDAIYGPEIILMTSSNLAVSYSNVEGGQDEAYLMDDSSVTWGAGNIDRIPRFVGAGDYASCFPVCGRRHGRRYLL
jgi:hypothetical protein